VNKKISRKICKISYQLFVGFRSILIGKWLVGC